MALVTYLNNEETEFRRKLDRINKYMIARDIPPSLRTQVREYYYHVRKSEKTRQNYEVDILNELSGRLRERVTFAVSETIVKSMPFFAGCDPEFVIELANGMHSAYYHPKEEILREGDIGNEMFYIVQGAVEVVKDKVRLVVLGRNHHFAEMRILEKDKPHTASVFAVNFTELHVIHRTDVFDALKAHPRMRSRIREASYGLKPKAAKLLLSLDTVSTFRQSFIESCATSSSLYSYIKARDFVKQEHRVRQGKDNKTGPYTRPSLERTRSTHHGSSKTFSSLSAQLSKLQSELEDSKGKFAR